MSASPRHFSKPISSFMPLVALLMIGCLGGLSTETEAAELGVLTPVMSNGVLLQKADDTGRVFPVFERMTEGPLYARLQLEATEGFTATVIKLDELAQRLAGAASASPSWLYLSQEEGGFARTGFWLREGSNERFLAEPFVDLVVDEGSIESGGFEEIFAHEMGHVYLRRLLPSLPHGYSRTPHYSFTVTDYPTAFDEGFAIHMQGLVRRLTQNRSLRNEDLGLEAKPLVNYWLSNIDRAARIDGMRRNWFVQAQVAMSDAAGSRAGIDLSTLFDWGRLKSGNQMMACEGVIATLFYRWLVPGAPEEKVVLARYEQLFRALRRLDQKSLQPESVVYLDLVEVLRELQPELAQRVITMTVETTYGATADRTFATSIEKLAGRGRIGDIEVFVAHLGPARNTLARLIEDAKRDPARLRAALGQDLWLLVGKQAPASVNLNTAEREHLLELPGFDAASAERAIASRHRDGPFNGLEDFVRRSGATSDVAKQLASAMSEMQTVGPFPRR